MPVVFCLFVVNVIFAGLIPPLLVTNDCAVDDNLIDFAGAPLSPSLPLLAA